MTATEIDELARSVARENFKLNACEIELPAFQIERLQGSYDVIVANIIDGVLLQLQREMERRLVPGGYLILSGILEERDPGFKAAFSLFQTAEILKRLTLGEWVGYLLKV